MAVAERTSERPGWRPMRPDDLAAVSRVAAQVHADFPEDDAVFAERLRLFQPGCLIAECAGAPLGYAIAHPWHARRPPALDTLLGALPPAPGCLYWHDIALLPQARGLALGGAAVRAMEEVARRARLPAIELVSVHGSAPFWQAHGFAPVPPEADLAAKLAGYGAGAVFMRRPLEHGRG